MELAEARERVEHVRAMSGDFESADGAEDDLRRDVLRYLAEVAPAELGELARIALTTEEIDFPRYCA